MKPTTRDAYEFFHKGTLALAEVEHNGIRIDTDYLDNAIQSVASLIAERRDSLKRTDVWKEWRKRFREPKLTSDKQLGEILFNVLGLKGGKRTEGTKDLPAHKARWQVDEQALESIKHPFVKEYLALKKYEKVKNTYLMGIRREVDPKGFLHPSYNLAGGLDDERKGGAMSYRGSCSDPNFQNMPIRNKVMGKIIRQCFISRGHDYLLGEIDFSTIEVRIAACVTKDPKLIDYVKNSPPKDMHRDAAFLLFLFTQKQYDQLSSDQQAVFKKTLRDASKNKFVFPQFYGSYYLDCAESIWAAIQRGEWKVPGSDQLLVDYLAEKGIHELGECDEEKRPKPGTFEFRVQEVENIIWNEWFVEYTAWKKRWYNKYLETGEVYMPTGFVAHGVYRRNQVLNLPIQGPAFHCLLWSITRINEELKRYKMRSRIAGQIHDCLLPDIHKREIQDFLNIAKRVMTVDLPKAWPWIIVPLEIEVDIVPESMTWNDKEPWILKNDKWIPKPSKAA